MSMQACWDPRYSPLAPALLPWQGMAAAFLHVKGIPSSPVYDPSMGLFLTLTAVWFVGLAATLAEPALQVPPPHGLG